MTTPTEPQSPGEPEDFAAATPPDDTSPEPPADAGASASGPSPERDPVAPSPGRLPELRVRCRARRRVKRRRE